MKGRVCLLAGPFIRTQVLDCCGPGFLVIQAHPPCIILRQRTARVHRRRVAKDTRAVESAHGWCARRSVAAGGGSPASSPGTLLPRAAVPSTKPGQRRGCESDPGVKSARRRSSVRLSSCGPERGGGYVVTPRVARLEGGLPAPRARGVPVRRRLRVCRAYELRHCASCSRRTSAHCWADAR